MSDLQLGLIGLGALVVIVVLLFNQFQARQLNRRIAQSARPPRVDAPADANAETIKAQGESGRLEPRIVLEPRTQSGAVVDATASATAPSQSAPVAATGTAESAIAPIDFVCRIDAPGAVAQARINELISAVSVIGKPARLSGYNPVSGEWIALPVEPAPPVERITVALQLANRAGPVNRVQLSTCRDLAQRFAEDIGAGCTCSDVDEALRAAADLDRFCAEVDISLGCNITPAANGGLAGTKLRGLLESAGFLLEQSGRFALRTEDGAVLLTAEDMSGEALTPERMRQQPIPGITLCMDVPRVSNGARVFDRMFEVARHLAHTLDAVVVDDNRSALTDAGLKVIRQQLRDVHAAMEARGIPAGSALAGRLFS
jgi:hypothetical protein